MLTRRNILVVAVVCLLALLLSMGVERAGGTTTASRRPFRVYGDGTLVIDWTSPYYDTDGLLYVPWTVKATRICTEGWFTDEGEGVFCLNTGILSGSGLCAEYQGGGLVRWESTQEYGSQHVDVHITGGSGKFDGIGGDYGYDYTLLDTERDQHGNPAKLTYSFWGKGAMITR